MIYREIRQEDIGTLFQVRTATLENAFSLEELHALGITEESISLMLQSTHQGWLCEIEGRVVGFCMGDRSTGEIWVLAVRPEFEGKGIGSKLLTLTEQPLWAAGYKKLWLVTGTDRSLRAYSFYKSRGWQEVGVKKNDLRMEKPEAD